MSTGESSYRNRAYRIVTGTLAVDSKWGHKGDPSSVDLPLSMFGIIRVDGRRLSYDFFVVDPDGSHGLFDKLRIAKE